MEKKGHKNTSKVDRALHILRTAQPLTAEIQERCARILRKA
jgi:hypothetical protein